MSIERFSDFLVTNGKYIHTRIVLNRQFILKGY